MSGDQAEKTENTCSIQPIPSSDIYVFIYIYIYIAPCVSFETSLPHCFTPIMYSSLTPSVSPTPTNAWEIHLVLTVSQTLIQTERSKDNDGELQMLNTNRRSGSGARRLHTERGSGVKYQGGRATIHPCWS